MKLSRYYIDEDAHDRMNLYTYGLIAEIAAFDPARGVGLRRDFSAAVASGDEDFEMRVGMEIENIRAEYPQLPGRPAAWTPDPNAWIQIGEE